MHILCPNESIASAIAKIEKDDQLGLDALASLVILYPGDARLAFLQGSVLVGLRRYGEAREALERAMVTSPDYAIARFQLGFLQYTSGESALAARTWTPFAARAADDAFRLFAEGLNALAQNAFETAIDLMNRGIAANADNPALNADMARLIDEVAKQRRDAEGDPPLSSTQFLLQQSSLRTRH